MRFWLLALRKLLSDDMETLAVCADELTRYRYCAVLVVFIGNLGNISITGA